MRHFSYGDDGSFQSGTFADYTVPTATEVPDIDIVHLETPSAHHSIGGQRGWGRANCMSTPVCIANAVADALNVENVELPLTPARVLALMAPHEAAAPEAVEPNHEHEPQPLRLCGARRRHGLVARLAASPVGRAHQPGKSEKASFRVASPCAKWRLTPLRGKLSWASAWSRACSARR